jgi:hypothetical protein
MFLKLKYKFKRLRVIIRRWKRNIDSFRPDDIEATTYEEKGLRLWRMVIRDESTQMAYNAEGTRQIEKGTLFITLTPSNSVNRYTMTIMDISGTRRSLYELHVEGKSAALAIESFDDEMQRRMQKVENNKRNLIETDIDKLIHTQFLALKKQQDEKIKEDKKIFS